MKITATCILCAALATPLSAQDATQTKPAPVAAKIALDKQRHPGPEPINPAHLEFVRASLISTFYHELAHAVIHSMDIPVLAHEEDAADIFSALMIDREFSTFDSRKIVEGALAGAKIDAADFLSGTRTWDWSDNHGHDMQRYYTLACLYYGADPQNRAAFAKTANIPTDRAETCAEEYDMANDSWSPIIDALRNDYLSETLITFKSSARTHRQISAADIIKTEIDRVNTTYHLPKTLRVVIKRCKRNSDFLAFYAPNRHKITLCTNYIDNLYRDAP